MNSSDSSEKFREFIRNKTVLVADVSPRALDFISALLNSMGVDENHLVLAPDYGSAQTEIEKRKPEIVLCDYDLDKKCGLALIETQRKLVSSPGNSLFVLVTGNTSQLAVARAAEEDVDAYVLKPFTGGVLRDTILKAAHSKSDPNEYNQALDKGKNLLTDGKLDEAEKTFEHAKTLNNAPALACYYLGQVYFARKDLPKAQEKYLTGLKYNRIHHKCMMGLYEALMEQKLYADAYAVIKRVSHYFPAHVGRLTAMLKLTILTGNYDDVERCYQTFKSLDQKTDELVRYVCAALVVCGKYYLQKNFKSRSIDLFNRALKTSVGNTKILREIIVALLEFQLEKDAEEFIRAFPEKARQSVDYLALSYLIADKKSAASTIINRGQQLLSDGHHDPLIYQIMIRRTIETLEIDAAQSLIKSATQKWPHMKEKFEKLLTAKP